MRLPRERARAIDYRNRNHLRESFRLARNRVKEEGMEPVIK